MIGTHPKEGARYAVLGFHHALLLGRLLATVTCSTHGTDDDVVKRYLTPVRRLDSSPGILCPDDLPALEAGHHVPDCHTGCCRRCASPNVPLLMTLRVVTEGIATFDSEILGTVSVGFRSSVPYHEECPAWSHPVSDALVEI